MKALPAHSESLATLLDLRLQARTHTQHAARLLAAHCTESSKPAMRCMKYGALRPDNPSSDGRATSSPPERPQTRLLTPCRQQQPHCIIASCPQQHCLPSCRHVCMLCSLWAHATTAGKGREQLSTSHDAVSWTCSMFGDSLPALPATGMLHSGPSPFWYQRLGSATHQGPHCACVNWLTRPHEESAGLTFSPVLCWWVGANECRRPWREICD